MGLTFKQMEFSKNIVAGLTDQQSYMQAYNCKSKNAASIEAMKLLKRDDIQAYIAELRKPIETLYQSKIITERQKQIDYIKSRIALCEKTNDEQSIIRYTDMLNKILALYKDTEQDQQQQNTLNNIDIDTLKKLTQ